MKHRLVLILASIIAVCMMASAQRVKFAAGVDGGYSFSKLGHTRFFDEATQRTWEVGLQGEARVHLVSFIYANTVLNLNFNYIKRRCMRLGNAIPPGEPGAPAAPNKYWHESRKGIAIQLTEYLNFKVWRGWGLGTGPAVKFSTEKDDWDTTKWRAYWVFGVDKDFGPFTAKLTWNQLLNKTRYFSNQLNLSLTYTF